jgi:hypothetical protein
MTDIDALIGRLEDASLDCSRRAFDSLDAGLAANLAQEAADALAEQAKRIKALASQNNAAWQFTARLFEAVAWGGDIDGETIFEWGLEYGLLVRKKMGEGTDDLDRCANCDGDCDYCNRFSPELQRRVNALRTTAPERKP